MFYIIFFFEIVGSYWLLTVFIVLLFAHFCIKWYQNDIIGPVVYDDMRHTKLFFGYAVHAGCIKRSTFLGESVIRSRQCCHSIRMKNSRATHLKFVCPRMSIALRMLLAFSQQKR